MPIGGVGGVYRGQKTVQLMGLGLKANGPIGFLYFWRGLARLKSRLKVLAFSCQLGGFRGVYTGQKTVQLLGFGLKANGPLVFLYF